MGVSVDLLVAGFGSVARKSVGAGERLANAAGVAASGVSAWEPRGEALDSSRAVSDPIWLGSASEALSKEKWPAFQLPSRQGSGETAWRVS